MAVTGEVISRQELLNGTETLTLEGGSADGSWSLVLEFSRNRGLVEFAGEGDITLTRSDGAELFGSLGEARVVETVDGALQFTLTFDLDGGSGEFEDAAGVAAGTGALGADTFDSQWRIELSDRPAEA
jgi:hypothetical protein